jgi:hypothetical protein
MNKILLVVLLIIWTAIVFVLGGGLGVFYQTQKNAPMLEKFPVLESIVNNLSSSTMSTILVSGKVSNIYGRYVTINNKGTGLTVKIMEDAKITSLVASDVLVDGKYPILSKTATFEDIKKGDNVRINIKVLSDGKIEGDFLMIHVELPPTN